MNRKTLSRSLLVCSLFLACLLPHKAICQTKSIDSLLLFIKKSPEDTTKVRACRILANNYTNLNNAEKLKYSTEAYTLSKKIKYINGIILSSIDLGDFYISIADYEKGRTYYDEAIIIAHKANNLSLEAFSLSNKGVSYERQGDFENALKNYLKSQKIREAIYTKNPSASSAETVTSLAQLYNNIGAIMHTMKRDKEAHQYFDKALEMFSNRGNNPSVLGAIYLNTGNIYGDEGNIEKALEYFKKAETIFISNHDDPSLAVIELNIAILYEMKKMNADALTYYNKGLALSKKVDDKNVMSYAISAIALLNAKMGQKADAIKALEEAMTIAKTIHSKSSELNVYQNYYSVYKLWNDSPKALAYYEKYTTLKDSLFGIENTKQLNELQTKYNVEKNENQLKLQKEELKRNELEIKSQSNQKITFLLGLIVMIILSYFIFSNYRKQKKISELVAKQKALVEEKQKEILDSIQYAKRIQRSLLPTEKYIEKNMNRLKK